MKVGFSSITDRLWTAAGQFQVSPSLRRSSVSAKPVWSYTQRVSARNSANCT
jgi:hypothetical protein